MKRLLFKIVDRLTKNTEMWKKLYSDSENWTYKQLKDYQFTKLKKVCRAHNIIIKSWEDFYKLPLTTKEDLRKYNYPLSIFRNKKQLTSHSSSGSTGEPLTTYGPYFLQSIKSAIFERAWKWVGWNGKDWVLRLTAGEPEWKFFDWCRNVKPMNYRTVGPKHIEWIIKHKPFLIHGGAGAIREITTKIREIGMEYVLKDINLFLMSEDTRQHEKELSKYYKNVYSGYGLAELCTVASHCKCKSWHVNMETCIVESINGEIVITDLDNYITPILRYRTSDFGRVKHSNCGCGIKHDILYDIIGRGIDYYDGPLTKKSLGWWIVSPISHKYEDIISRWKVKVDLKKNKFILYVVWKKKPENCDEFIWYSDFIKRESGLDLEIIEVKKMPNKNRMKLLEIVE